MDYPGLLDFQFYTIHSSEQWVPSEHKKTPTFVEVFLIKVLSKQIL